ncbi:MAG: hypothetical protein F4X39_07735 [Acidobacteriia bacterium]|nr:hypothetical protein [Terriglobia bacterium]
MAVSREDGVPLDLSDELGHLLEFGYFESRSPIPLGSSIPLGEISAGEAQEIELVISYNRGASPVRLYFTASAWNAKAASASVGVQAGGSDRSEVAGRPPPPAEQRGAALGGREGARGPGG